MWVSAGTSMTKKNAQLEKAVSSTGLTCQCGFQETSFHSRLGIVYNPTSKINEESTVISRGILAAFLTHKNKHLRSFLRRLAEEETAEAIYSGDKVQTFLAVVSTQLHVSSVCTCVCLLCISKL
jgi:hypothetical protein